MGRPKVPYSERRRAAVACTFCRSTKRKCSATVPCVQCQRRGLASSCSFASSAFPSPGASARAPPSSPLLSSPSASTIRPPSAPGSASFPATQGRTSPPSRTIRRDGTGHRRDPVQTPAHRRSTASLSGSRPTWTQPRLLFNTSGEQIYIGQAASLSFLQLAREIVAEHIGPSKFSHNGKIQTMLETAPPAETAQTPIEPLESTVGVEQMLSFARVYNDSVDGLMDLFAPSEIEGLLVGSNATDARYRNPYKRATVDLVVAIGAQCTSPDAASRIGKPYFRHAQKLAMSETLEDPNVDMIRVFLLMAYYMLGACRRNAAFMYIGIATRAAVVLGLHSRVSYTDMSQPRFLLRLRIWLSLCNLDMTVSAILGRPAATAMLRTELDNALHLMTAAVTSNDMGLCLLLPTYKILGIINDIVENLYGRTTVSVTFIEQYLDAIDAWRRDFGKPPAKPSPSHVRNFHSIHGVYARSENSIGTIHVSCLYYFAVTLATRPILTHSLVAPPDQLPDSWAQVATACVIAATYLVQTCVDAQDAGLLLGNMCILKALVFIAGLILGLESFSKQQIDHEVEAAFAGARRNLAFLAVLSPQANHYLEILRLLQIAITKQRQHHTHKNRNRYVTRLFSPSPASADPNTFNPAPESLSYAAKEATASPPATMANVQVQVAERANEDGQNARSPGTHAAPFRSSPNGSCTPADPGIGEMLLDWADCNLSQWDDFL